MDPATAAAMAAGFGQAVAAPPAVSGTGPQNSSVYVEGMQIPGQAAAGYASLVWPAVIGLVALVWLRR